MLLLLCYYVNIFCYKYCGFVVLKCFFYLHLSEEIITMLFVLFINLELINVEKYVQCNWLVTASQL